MGDTEQSVKHCTRCEDAFWIGKHDDYGDVLDHWAAVHSDLEEFWRVVGDSRAWTRCGGCGEMFPSKISACRAGLTVRLYCDECADNGLEDKMKSLLVDDVTGQYVLDNEVCGEGSE